MTGKQCKHCEVIKTLSGPKLWCEKHNRKCPCRNRLKCLDFKSKEKPIKCSLADYKRGSH